jgi:hypothetical protein
MTHSANPSSILASKSYAALRYEGIPPPKARAALGLEAAAAARLEGLFQAQPGAGSEAMRPRFARHEAHVAAVLAQGGYPAIAR